MEKLFVKWAPLTHCGRPSLWHGSARPAFPGVAMWWPPLAARIWRAPPHGDKNIRSYTLWRYLKYRSYLFVDITEISTVSVLSSNQNEAYIRCQLKLETLTWPDPMKWIASYRVQADHVLEVWAVILSLTHWGRVTHICVVTNTNIGSDNGLSPGQRQAIIWTNAGIVSIGPLATNFSEILIKILTFSFKKMRFKVSSAKWQPSCLGLNVLNQEYMIISNALESHLLHKSLFLGDWLACMDYMDPDVCCPRKVVKLIHSLTRGLIPVPWWASPLPD